MGDAKNFDEQLYTGDPLTTVKDLKKNKTVCVPKSH